MSDILENMASEYDTNVKFDPLHYRREKYAYCILYPNELPFWFSRIKDCGFRVPETKIIQLPLELFASITENVCDHYGDERPRKDLLKFIAANWDCTPGDLKITDKLFFRTGISSFKFGFNIGCIVNGPESIPECVYSTIYDGLCQNKPESIYLVFREFIETTTERPAIYHGMKLNTEFRVFYDFDNHKLLDTFNYWGDKEAMLDCLSGDEAENYKSAFDSLQSEYDMLRNKLEQLCTEHFSKVFMRDKWSVDFMWTGSEFVLIDMGLAVNSYFADRLGDKLDE